MAGQLPLDIRYYPNDFCVTVQTITLGTTGASNPITVPILTADRDIVIDSVSVFMPTVLATNARDLKLKFMESTTGAVLNTLPTYATDTQDIGVAKTFSTTGGDYPQTHDFPVGTTRNGLRKGSRLYLMWSGAPAVATAASTFQVTIRWRSQV